MSVSLYNYSEKCNGKPCPGDCDLCQCYDDEEVEQDGWKTWNTDCSWGKPEDLGETDADI